MAEDYIEKYIDPIATTTHTHKLMFKNQFRVKYRDPDEADEVLTKDVIEVDIVNGIVLTAQQEAIIHFIDTLMEDNNIVMLDELKHVLEAYSSKYRNILEGKI